MLLIHCPYCEEERPEVEFAGAGRLHDRASPLSTVILGRRAEDPCDLPVSSGKNGAALWILGTVPEDDEHWDWDECWRPLGSRIEGKIKCF